MKNKFWLVAVALFSLLPLPVVATDNPAVAEGVSTFYEADNAEGGGEDTSDSESKSNSEGTSGSEAASESTSDDGTCHDQWVCTDDAAAEDEEFNIPILGEINAKTVSLPLFSIVVGAVDGFNPCAMWILVFLISMLLGMKDRKKMWILGIAFIATSGLVYLLFMVSWLNLAVFLSKITIIRWLIAVFAIIFGMTNLYRYFASLGQDVGCDVTDAKKRSKIMEKIKKIVSEQKFALAVLGVMVLAASVNILELLCSLGLPVVFTQVLALNDLSVPETIFYFFLYMLFFLLDDIIIFVIAMTTLKIKGISNKYTKYSHLIGGIIMVILGLLMVLKPEWLMFNF